MKLLIFGSTGGTGHQLVELALARGHAVTAFARNPTKVSIKDPNLKIARGDVTDVASIERAMPGQEAVLSALGSSGRTKDTARSEGMPNIVRAMQAAGVRRLVCLSSMGIGDSRDMLPFLSRYVLVPLFMRQGFAEHELQEACVKRSGTDWTIVRPAALTNGARTGVYRHGLVADQSIKRKISRADVADFMLKQLVENTYLRKSPWISY